jgi:hypothetical protein
VAGARGRRARGQQEAAGRLKVADRTGNKEKGEVRNWATSAKQGWKKVGSAES